MIKPSYNRARTGVTLPPFHNSCACSNYVGWEDVFAHHDCCARSVNVHVSVLPNQSCQHVASTLLRVWPLAGESAGSFFCTDPDQLRAAPRESVLLESETEARERAPQAQTRHCPAAGDLEAGRREAGPSQVHNLALRQLPAMMLVEANSSPRRRPSPLHLRADQSAVIQHFEQAQDERSERQQRQLSVSGCRSGPTVHRGSERGRQLAQKASKNGTRLE